MRPAARSLAAAPARLVRRGAVVTRTRSWTPASRLFVLSDVGGWVLDEEAQELTRVASRLGYDVAPPAWAPYARGQAVFHTSHFDVLTPRWLDSSHRLGTSYFHGRPGTPDMPEFDRAYDALRRRPERLTRVQVTHAEMHDLVLEAGVDPERVFRIPIGIDLAHFPLGDADARREARTVLGLPATAFVVGSFQKDGVGWGDGFEPKLVKGPDVLVAALDRLREQVSEVFVLLTGPARGYVRRELERRGIPHLHLLVDSRQQLARAYQALDVYLIASRQEGGPKAALEAMAAGVPLVSTRVGQVPELVEHGRSAYLVDVDDAEALAAWAESVHRGPRDAAGLRASARRAAEDHAHGRLDRSWAALLEDFVLRGPG